MIIKKLDLKFNLVAITLLTMNSCNSFYNQEYIYFPPNDPKSRECILDCQFNRENCNNLSNKSYQECLREVEKASMLNYNINLNDNQTSITTKNSRTIEQCQAYTKACQQGYNDCYIACGGKIEMNDYSNVSYK